MIKFGTSGWRAVMGEHFTFQNVRIVVQAIANYLHRQYPDESISVIISYDTRFLSERFAFEAAKVMAHNRIHTFMSDRDAPSQALAYQIIRRKAQGGINFTASFNPPEYNGLKFNVASGAPALPKETDIIEEEVRILLKDYGSCPYYPKTEFIEKINLQQEYLRYIQNKIDFDLIRNSGIKIGVDLLYGTSREYLDEILVENRIPLEAIHGFIDPYFGGITPSCTEENLGELKALVLEKNCQIGISTDADGDRFGIVDEKGRFVDQNIVLALILDYLVVEKGWRGGVARSIATTHFIDQIARSYDCPLYKTPVGFKYIAELLLADKIIFGGEESACLGIKDHLPEKDGIMAGLLICESLAASKKTLSEKIEDFFRRYGNRERKERAVPLTLENERKLKRMIRNPPSRIGDRKVENVETIDGIKLDFTDDDWLLMRLSGTIPVIRCYAEAKTKKEVEKLLELGLNYIEDKT